MGSEPLVRLPERVCFNLREAGRILFALDVGVRLAPAESTAGRLVRGMQRLVTARLWPELGVLLEDEDRKEG